MRMIQLTHNRGNWIIAEINGVPTFVCVAKYGEHTGKGHSGAIAVQPELGFFPYIVYAANGEPIYKGFDREAARQLGKEEPGNRLEVFEILPDHSFAIAQGENRWFAVPHNSQKDDRVLILGGIYRDHNNLSIRQLPGEDLPLQWWYSYAGPKPAPTQAALDFAVIMRRGSRLGFDLKHSKNSGNSRVLVCSFDGEKVSWENHTLSAWDAAQEATSTVVSMAEFI